MKNFERAYFRSIDDILIEGIDTVDRTGVGRRRIMGQHFAFAAHEDGRMILPVLRGKKVFPKMGIKEITWMMKGDTNIAFLEKHGVTYWREWADENGDLGPVYGYQMRNFNGVDQLEWLLYQLVNHPESSRSLISFWNPADLNKMKLPPCHFLYHFIVIPEKGVNYLHLHLTQRSADAFLGVPYNAIMASYFLNVIAKICDYHPGNVYWTLNDYHLYMNHISQAKQYLNNVMEDKFGTIGKNTIFKIEGLEPYTESEKKNSKKLIDKFDEFINYCDENMFKNIIVYNIDSYDKIEADIAV